MAYGEYYVERQGWAHWPKVLIMCRKRGDGIERRRYVPETELQMTRDELREECQRADMAEMKLRHHISVLESVKDTNIDIRQMWREKDAENEKLRELLTDARKELADMYDYMDGGYAWPSIGEDPSFGPFYRRLCDTLGVEVDG